MSVLIRINKQMHVDFHQTLSQRPTRDDDERTHRGEWERPTFRSSQGQAEKKQTENGSINECKFPAVALGSLFFIKILRNTRIGACLKRKQGIILNAGFRFYQADGLLCKVHQHSFICNLRDFFFVSEESFLLYPFSEVQESIFF